MGSIPLPALSIHNQVQQPDPVEQYGRILQLKNMMALAPLQQQEAQQRVQSGQLDMQQKQREMDSQNAIMKAYTDSGGDLDKTYQAASQTGKVLPGDLVKIQQANYQMKQQAFTMLQEKGKLATQQADMYDGAADLVNKAPAEAKPALYQQQLQNLQQAGVDVSKLPPQYPGDQQFQALHLGLKSFSAALNEAQKQAEAQKDTAQGREANANAALKEQQATFGPAGEYAKAKYQFILQKAAGGAQLSPDELNFAKGYEASEAKNTTQSDSLGITSNNTSRPAGLASVMKGQPRPAAAPVATSGAPLLPSSNLPSSNAMSPANVKSSLVDLIGQYRENPTMIQRIQMKHPEIMAMVAQKYPDWDQTTYNAKNKLVESYTAGPESKSINAINTAMGHVKVLDDAVDALNNGNVQLLNKIGNKIGTETGSTPQTTFQAIVHRVGPEITSAYLPGGGGEAERFANEKDFSENLSPQQLHDNAAITVKLLRSKVGALENQYKNAVGRDDFNQRFITPEAQAAFQKFGGAQGSPAASSGTSVTAPNGKVYTFKDQASADAFKAKAGIQ